LGSLPGALARLVADVGGCEGEVLHGGEVREEMESLEHHSHARPQRPKRFGVGRGAGRDLQAGDLDAPRIERGEPVEAAQEGALARAGRADQGDGLAARDLRVDSAQHLARAVRLGEALYAEDHVATATTGSSPAASSLASRRDARRASG
jgi:hypothetical protein